MSAAHIRILMILVMLDQLTAHRICKYEALPPSHLPVRYKRALVAVIPIIPANRDRNKQPSTMPTKEYESPSDMFCAI